MGEAIFTILLFFGIIAVTVVLFGGWVIVSIVRLVFRAFSGESNAPRQIAQMRQVRCPRQRCGAQNPDIARFCRRCGHELTMAHEIQFRRAAML